ncbi:MAG: CPBP family intramembrane metalloprotease, partial [Tenericutes bacterium]|nr:CPBP family intramembrane metalloprotease [Mycoplasmatota bacterium]
ITEPDINLQYGTDTTVISVDFTASLLNSSDKDLSQIWVTIELFDADEESLGLYKFSKDDFSQNEMYILDEEISIDFIPFSFETNYGIELSNAFYIMLGTMQALTCAVLFIIIDRKSFKANWIQLKERPIKYIGQIALGFGIVFGSLIFASLILEFLGVTETSQNEATIRGYFVDDTFRLITLFFMLCVFTPIVEEVVFRKVVYNFFQPKLGNVVAVLGTGIIFGLMHVISFGDFIQSIPYIFMGIAFGYIYYRSNRNIYVVIGVHFINNFVTFAMYVLILYGYYSL